MKGRIIKGIGGFYYVETENGIIQTRGRGIFRKSGITLMVGDEVEMTLQEDGDGVIDSIYPRTSEFVRPPITNVDHILIVFCVKKPKPNFDVIDKFLIRSLSKGIQTTLCINKCDLAKEDEIEEVLMRYQGAAPIITVSAKENVGINELKKHLIGKRTALAGFSGVGKSTLTNLLIPEAHMETGEIGTKNSRGKHTTRHVQIFHLEEGGLLYDTPGFLSLELEIEDVMPEDLDQFYPEFSPYLGLCKFDDCTHRKEPGCAIRENVEQGKIPEERYLSYQKNYQELYEQSQDWNRRKK